MMASYPSPILTKPMKSPSMSPEVSTSQAPCPVPAALVASSPPRAHPSFRTPHLKLGNPVGHRVDLVLPTSSTTASTRAKVLDAFFALGL
ncbi:MAG: hypothetical protein AAF984_00540 [Verrucomicrobiota bacterium]